MNSNAPTASLPVFSDDERAWMARGRYVVHTGDDGVVVANDGGEIRYFLVEGDGEIVVRRAERDEKPLFVFSARAAVNVARYLFREIGVDVRSYAGFAQLRFPVAEHEVAPGFETVLFSDGSTGLRHAGGEVLEVRFGSGSARSAVKFSYLADASPADIRRSFAAPSGAPLFTAFAV